MARYRKIDPRIWNDEKFRMVSDDAKLIFFLLLTHPHMTALGAMRATLAGLAAALGWPGNRFRRGFAQLLQQAMVRHDEGAACIWLPHFLKYNPPENPNVVKSWQASLDLLPECPLKDQVLQGCRHLVDRLPQGFREGLPEPLRKGMPNQEQEPEPEPEPEGECSPPVVPLTGNQRHTHPSPVRTARGRQATPASPFPPEYTASATLRATITAKYPGVDVDALVDAMRDWALGKGVWRSNWDAVLRTFARRAYDDLQRNGGGPRRHASTTEHNLAALAEAKRLSRERTGDGPRAGF
jgi:hypothetical protein